MSRSVVPSLANRSVNASPSRNANRICTPVCATRSSGSSSAKLRSARFSGISLRSPAFQVSSRLEDAVRWARRADLAVASSRWIGGTGNRVEDGEEAMN